jgi:23S rRNA (adenine2503-C2)-methyltransferase
MAPTTRYDFSRAELETLLEGEPSYRVKQVWEGLYDQRKSPDEMLNLPKSLRAKLKELLPPGLTEITASKSKNKQTVKYLWELHDGARVESVLMHYKERSTVCISSQAGCAMACSFCATGQAGFERHLSPGEIIEQVVRASETALPRRVDNIVFMGMGEPLANFENTWEAVRRINKDLGIGARHITMSTVGVIPGILAMAKEPEQVGLAVSLHSADPEVRNKLVPLNKRYGLEALAEACHVWLNAHNRRLSFEWAMIDGVNDSPRDARMLAEYARPLRAHVNLIPLNPTPGYLTKGSTLEVVHDFRDELESFGVNATVRRTRGNEIDAACGQLRAGHQVAVPKPARRSAKLDK